MLRKHEIVKISMKFKESNFGIKQRPNRQITLLGIVGGWQENILKRWQLFLAELVFVVSPAVVVCSLEVRQCALDGGLRKGEKIAFQVACRQVRSNVYRSQIAGESHRGRREGLSSVSYRYRTRRLQMFGKDTDDLGHEWRNLVWMSLHVCAK